MAGIIEYISLNYTWFLVGTIIIILAIIGYYADKTNFGNGKNKSNKNENENLKGFKNDTNKLIDNNILNSNETQNDELLDVKEIFEENSQDNQADINTENIESSIVENDFNGNKEKLNNEALFNNIQSIDSNNNSTINNEIENVAVITDNSVDQFKTDTTKDTINNENLNDINNNIHDNSNIDNDQKDNTLQSDESIKNLEDNFEKFEEEFNSIIPEKEIITGELLDDIDNLSLDKKEKFSLDDIPDLDDVDLPEIRDTKISDNDIWKF